MCGAVLAQARSGQNRISSVSCDSMKGQRLAAGQDPLQKDKNRQIAVADTDSEKGIIEPPRTWSEQTGRSYRSTWQAILQSGKKSQTSDNVSVWEHQALLWVSFLFASGIAVYFTLPAEPYWPLLVAVLTFAVLCAFFARNRAGLGRFALLALSFWAGLTCAALRTAFVDAPRISEEINVNLSGYVIERSDRVGRTRLVLKVDTVNDRPLTKTLFPKKVRVSVPQKTDARVGDKVQLRARLFPPAGPVVPGGYDYSLRAYFSQVGATGFSFGQPQIVPQSEVPLRIRGSALLQSLRSHLKEKITTSLPEGQEAGLIVALLVGDRSGISETQEENLRAAGLAHILAISGLHMALFAGGAYAAALFLMALFPSLSLNWPIHKFAAVAALFAAVFYLLVSGASVATQRSFLMIALVFLAILIGRRGLTLRSVALAGLVLLVLAPERLFFPGFQMSFAAVICLVAVYETWRNRLDPFARLKRPSARMSNRIALSAFQWAAGILITALVAGLATGIIAAHHFGRIAPFGLLGNFLGMPIFSLLVMPMGVLAMILMPFGLAALPLTVMKYGIDLLLWIAAFVAGLDDGAGAIGRVTVFEMVAFSAALFALLLLRGWWRLSATGPLLIGVLLLLNSPPPDIQIAASGNRIAARDDNGTLRWVGQRRSFVSDIWYQTEGVEEGAIRSHKMKSPQVRCDETGCVVRAYAFREGDVAQNAVTVRYFIALPRSQDALRMDCRYADLIVSDLVVFESCDAGLVIDRTTRRLRGAVSIWLSQEKQAGGSLVSDGIYLRNGTETTKAIKVDDIRFAVSANPRPWHKKGEVARVNLR